MDSEIVWGSFSNDFVPLVEKVLELFHLLRREILVIYSVPSHPNEDELIFSGNIRVIFLPPHITSLCQPMDQGLLEAQKKKYHCKFLTTHWGNRQWNWYAKYGKESEPVKCYLNLLDLAIMTWGHKLKVLQRSWRTFFQKTKTYKK